MAKKRTSAQAQAPADIAPEARAAETESEGRLRRARDTARYLSGLLAGFKGEDLDRGDHFALLAVEAVERAAERLGVEDMAKEKARNWKVARAIRLLGALRKDLADPMRGVSTSAYAEEWRARAATDLSAEVYAKATKKQEDELATKRSDALDGIPLDRWMSAIDAWQGREHDAKPGRRAAKGAGTYRWDLIVGRLLEGDTFDNDDAKRLRDAFVRWEKERQSR